jgi:hypothetical protein
MSLVARSITPIDSLVVTLIAQHRFSFCCLGGTGDGQENLVVRRDWHFGETVLSQSTQLRPTTTLRS